MDWFLKIVFVIVVIILLVLILFPCHEYFVGGTQTARGGITTIPIGGTAPATITPIPVPNSTTNDNARFKYTDRQEYDDINRQLKAARQSADTCNRKLAIKEETCRSALARASARASANKKELEKIKNNFLSKLQKVKETSKKTLQKVKEASKKGKETGNKAVQKVKLTVAKKYGCENGWKYDGARTCSKTQKSKTVCKAGKLRTFQSCPSGQKVHLSGCYVNGTNVNWAGNRKGTAKLVTKCDEFADERLTKPAKQK